jgi:hypothetical protein
VRHAVALALLVLAACSSAPPSYPDLRLSAEEEVPGTWGLVLRPPPEDLDPAIAPRKARRLAIRIETEGELFETLAVVPRSFTGDEQDRAAWVVFARSLCFAQSKGDLVSSSRRDPQDVERCSDANLWVEMIDPMTGESLASTSGYDETERWVPAMGSD